MIVQTLKMCTSDAGSEQSLVLFIVLIISLCWVMPLLKGQNAIL